MADSKITALTATSSPVDTAEFAANEGGNDRKYTRAEIVAGVAGDLSSYETSNDAAVALKAPLASPTFTGTINATGATTNVAAPSSGSNATTKTYVDTADALAVLKAGSTMTGALTLSGAPSSSLHAATKAYVDTADALLLPLAGGTMTGNLTLAGAPSSSLHATTKTYVDTADALALKGPGTLNCAANPNYPASTAFDTHRVTGAGKVGGASGITVEVGDLIICHTTSAAGDHATVGANFFILQANLTAATESTSGYVELASAAEMDPQSLSSGNVVTDSGLLDFFDEVMEQKTASTAGPHVYDIGAQGIILVSYDAGVTTIELPDPATVTNTSTAIFYVMKTSNSAPSNGITFQATGGANVNGASTFTLAAAECEHTIICITDGSRWYVR